MSHPTGVIHGHRLSLLASPAPRTVLAVAGGLALTVAVAADDAGPVICPFRRCTGGYCPGCGLTRATGRLLRGDVAGSWHLHPFLLPAVAQAILALSFLALARARARAGLRRFAVPVAAANAVVLLSIWAIRMSLGHIPPPFG